MIFLTLRRGTALPSIRNAVRSISTLQSNPHIYIFPESNNNNNNSSSNSSPKPSSYILSLLPTTPPNKKLAVGTTTSIPPTPDSLAENPHFLAILNDTLSKYASQDPIVQGQAAIYASVSGVALGAGGGGGGGGSSAQGGAGGGGRGGWVHVSDLRAPPDYGRIASPEDIFGSVEVDGRGEFVKGSDSDGNWQASGSYRVITREGILGLSDFLRGKLVERLREEEAK